MKGELEQLVQTLPFKRTTIFQPSLLRGNRRDLRIGEKIGGGILDLLCKFPGLRRFRPIAGEEVAAKMIQVSKEPGPAVEWFRLEEIFPG